MYESSDKQSQNGRKPTMTRPRERVNSVAWVVRLMYAHLTGAHVAVSVDKRDSIIHRLPGRNIVLGIGKDSVSVTSTIEAASHRQAALVVESACDDAFARAEIRDMHIVDCHVLSAERLGRTNATIPDLVGVSEIAEMMGVSKQRAWQYTKKDTFPDAVQETKAGRFWDVCDVEIALQARSAGHRLE